VVVEPADRQLLLQQRELHRRSSSPTRQLAHKS
jgi:hypothetical protein